MHDAWVDALAREELRSWSLDELFRIVDAEPTHSVTPHAKDFNQRWVELAQADARGIPSSTDARQLVHARERRLKRSRSLFRNKRAREELYRGDLGLGRLSYRWSNVQVLLYDLHAGLRASRSCPPKRESSSGPILAWRRPTPYPNFGFSSDSRHERTWPSRPASSGRTQRGTR